MRVILMGQREEIKLAYSKMLKYYDLVNSERRILHQESQEKQHVISAEMQPTTGKVNIVLSIREKNMKSP